MHGFPLLFVLNNLAGGCSHVSNMSFLVEVFVPLPEGGISMLGSCAQCIEWSESVGLDLKLDSHFVPYNLEEHP